MQQAFNSEVAPTKIVPLVRTPDAMVHRILEVAAPCPYAWITMGARTIAPFPCSSVGVGVAYE